MAINVRDISVFLIGIMWYGALANDVVSEDAIWENVRIERIDRPDIRSLLIMTGDVPCLRIDNSADGTLLSVLGPDGRRVVAVTFDGNEPASVMAFGKPPTPVFVLLPGIPGRWGPATYGNMPENEGVGKGVYSDIDFDGRFDVKGRWDDNAPGGIAKPWIRAGDRWLETRQRLRENAAIVHERGKDIVYKFVESNGWVKNADVNEPPVARNVQDPNGVDSDWEGDSQVIARFDDVEVAKFEYASLAWEGLIIGRQGIPLIMLTKPFWKSSNKANLVIEIAIGNMAGFVNGEVTQPGVESLRIFTRDRKGGLFLHWSGEERAWRSAGYFRLGEGLAADGEQYWDIDMDGQFDLMAVTNAAGMRKDYAWILEGWRSIVEKAQNGKGVLLKRYGKTMRFVFIDGTGWKEVGIEGAR